MTTTASVFRNYIGGKWQSAQSGQTFPNYNPATSELLGYFRFQARRMPMLL